MAMAARTYTIGRIAKLSGIPVRRIRYYADEGLLPRVDRTDSNYRLFDETDLARLGLIKALRDAGLGLDTIRAVLFQKRSVRDVLSLRLVDIEAQIASQRRIAAAIRVALRSPEPSADDLRRIWMMTDASNAEYTATVARFLDEVVTGAAVDPRWRDWMLRMSAPTLPDEPSAAQLDAWIELSAMLADPQFIGKMRRNAEDSVIGLNFELFQQVTKSILAKTKAAMEQGLDPASSAGRAIADEYLAGWARATGTEPTPETLERLGRKHLEHRPNMRRYWELVSALNGLPRSEPTAEWQWIDRAASNRLADA